MEKIMNNVALACIVSVLMVTGCASNTKTIDYIVDKNRKNAPVEFRMLDPRGNNELMIYYLAHRKSCEHKIILQQLGYLDSSFWTQDLAFSVNLPAEETINIYYKKFIQSGPLTTECGGIGSFLLKENSKYSVEAMNYDKEMPCGFKLYELLPRANSHQELKPTKSTLPICGK